MPYADPETQREYQRQWMAKRRSEYFAGKCCARCGAIEDLELDHIDPTTKVTHRIWSWSAPRRDAELAKCQPLCVPCHDAKTLEDLPITQGLTPATHGSTAMYRRGCRCSSCRSAKARYFRDYRARNRKPLGISSCATQISA